MIPIEFRGLRTNGNGWAHGGLVLVCDGETLQRHPHIVVSYNYDTFDWDEVNPNTVSQLWTIDKEGRKIFEGDLRRDRAGKVFRIYRVDGGFVIKAHYWKCDCADLAPTDSLIIQALSDPQTAQWVLESTIPVGNIYEKTKENI